MNLKIFNDDGSVKSFEITKELFYDKNYRNKVSYIASSKKEENALNIFKSYFSDAKSILFDTTNKAILQQLEDLNIKSFNDKNKTQNIFNDKEFCFLYFTSGSTGFPLGALKTKENIMSEIKVLSYLINKSYTINKVVVTVPFIHLYGSLMGLFFPLFNNIDILLKEHFLPHDLLELIDEHSLVVTTPLYIKALNQLNSTKDLSQSLFISSTAPLHKEDVQTFKKKFQAPIIQIFGSTETGGIAYKKDDETLWMPLENVVTSVNNKSELKVSSPFISKTIFEKEFKQTQQTIETFDYVEFKQDKFKLIGRSSQILKISGKRYSTLNIEQILEQVQGIQKALVFVRSNPNHLKDEVLDITLESQQHFSSKEINAILKNHLSNIKFCTDVKIVEKIPTSSVGKKLKIES